VAQLDQRYTELFGTPEIKAKTTPLHQQMTQEKSFNESLD
jgi:hypothetical protein